MFTVFMFGDKKLFEVQGLVNIDVGDIVEYETFHHDATPTDDYPYPQYKVIGRKFRHEPAFSGKLIINLKTW